MKGTYKMALERKQFDCYNCLTRWRAYPAVGAKLSDVRCPSCGQRLLFTVTDLPAIEGKRALADHLHDLHARRMDDVDLKRRLAVVALLRFVEDDEIAETIHNIFTES